MDEHRSIVDEILDKKAKFARAHYGINPEWLYLSGRHFDMLRASVEYPRLIADAMRVPRKIMGMDFKIEHDAVEISVG